jgi:hypothetical protein
MPIIEVQAEVSGSAVQTYVQSETELADLRGHLRITIAVVAKPVTDERIASAVGECHAQGNCASTFISFVGWLIRQGRQVIYNGVPSPCPGSALGISIRKPLYLK